MPLNDNHGQRSQVSILEYMKLLICTEIAQCIEVKLRSSLTAVKFAEVKFDRGQV